MDGLHLHGDLTIRVKCCQNKKMCRVSARRFSIYNYAWELMKVTKKVPQKCKGTKIRMGATRRN
jgi:hypothetical protein